MLNILLVVHLLIALALIGVILMQKSEGGGLGIGGSTGGGGGGGMGGFMTGRGTANLLTRTTAVLAALFIIISLVLAKMSGRDTIGESMFDTPAPIQSEPLEQPIPDGPTAPIAR
jgi:preprotein translocase subunit SecG